MLVLVCNWAIAQQVICIMPLHIAWLFLQIILKDPKFRVLGNHFLSALFRNRLGNLFRDKFYSLEKTHFIRQNFKELFGKHFVKQLKKAFWRHFFEREEKERDDMERELSCSRSLSLTPYASLSFYLIVIFSQTHRLGSTKGQILTKRKLL